MDYLDTLLGAGLTAVAFLVGRVAGRRSREPKPIRPVCDCEHAISYHRDHTGRCGWSERYPYRCGCQKYSGPQPLPEYYAPEIG